MANTFSKGDGKTHTFATASMFAKGSIRRSGGAQGLGGLVGPVGTSTSGDAVEDCVIDLFGEHEGLWKDSAESWAEGVSLYESDAGELVLVGHADVDAGDVSIAVASENVSSGSSVNGVAIFGYAVGAVKA